MRLLKNNDLTLFEQLCSLSQTGLHKTMSSFLKGKYSKVKSTKDYIYAEGDIPIALVAHMDTVFPHPADNVYYDRVKNVLWSPEGLGADDRAGVFSIIQIIRAGLRPHIILTTDEERGAIGASKLSQIKCPFKDLRYIIQLDRRGTQDCVFYSCDNPQFTEYIESFGFVEAMGSFSDISVICPAWKVAGVNLSVGYEDEHSVSETLNAGAMLNTIEKVMHMLKVKNPPSFKYIHGYSGYMRWYKVLNNDEEAHQCKFCKAVLPSNELIPLKGAYGHSWEHCCIDCLSSDSIEWCSYCGEAFEIKEGQPNYKLCEECLSEIGRY